MTMEQESVQEFVKLKTEIRFGISTDSGGEVCVLMRIEGLIPEIEGGILTLTIPQAEAVVGGFQKAIESAKERRKRLA